MRLQHDSVYLAKVSGDADSPYAYLTRRKYGWWPWSKWEIWSIHLRKGTTLVDGLPTISELHTPVYTPMVNNLTHDEALGLLKVSEAYLGAGVHYYDNLGRNTKWWSAQR